MTDGRTGFRPVLLLIRTSVLETADRLYLAARNGHMPFLAPAPQAPTSRKSVLLYKDISPAINLCCLCKQPKGICLKYTRPLKTRKQRALALTGLPHSACETATDDDYFLRDMVSQPPFHHTPINSTNPSRSIVLCVIPTKTLYKLGDAGSLHL